MDTMKEKMILYANVVDVVMNKATIGFKGGCNPIPFEYKIENSKIIIDKKVLDKEKEKISIGNNMFWRMVFGTVIRQRKKCLR